MTGNKNTQIKEMGRPTAGGSVNWYIYFGKSQALINEVMDSHTILSSKLTPRYLSTCQCRYMYRAAFSPKRQTWGEGVRAPIDENTK